ncbi:MAG TPA: DUF4340 domain-containing protein [Pirellulales bacterium]|nr:DUF4340 domain-containing protein [Pirellulales bacterium]
MNENTKTISFVVAAAAVLLLAWAFRPVPPPLVTNELVGKSLFPDLDDPLKAKRMRIVTFDESTSQVREFEVAQVNGVWSLPSHKNYPADAKEQMASAAAALVDLKVLAPVSNDARDHELYGVVEPKTSEDQFGEKGVGKLVVIEDENGKALAKLIIGKEDKPSHSDELAGSQTQLRFVRVPGQDQVYRVQMNADKFSTNFSDWIETDLLKLNPWDIEDIKLHDYSVTDKLTPTGEIQPALMPRADIDLAYDDKTNKWNLKALQEYKDGKPTDIKLTGDEELNSAKLNDLKSALGSLKIVDVARKPSQLSADLKTEKGAIHEEAMGDLARRGFLPALVHNQFQIVSNDGEATLSMKDGVQYVLRFGEVAGIDSGSDTDKKKSPDGEKKDAQGEKAETAGGKAAAAGDNKSQPAAADDAEKGSEDPAAKNGGLSRYIMVMAQFNPDLISKPDLQPLPDIKKAPEKSAAGKTESGPADGAKANAPDKKADAKAESKKDAKKDDSKAGSETASKDDTDDLEALEAQRDRIEKENKRKQDEYDEKIKAGQQRAKELNARFSDWYYVVGNDTYRKIHLGQADIIQKKAPAEGKETGHAAIPKNPFELPGLPGATGQN